MIPLSCPNCKSKRTTYLGNNKFKCLDCKKEFEKNGRFKQIHK
jgi:DNA-directed RNA polymerase subunit RPC12/RpoP